MYHNYSYDVFISHAVEDKIPLVNELAARLEAKGIKVWYTGCELSIGDEVCDKLVEGMRQCRYGVVVFSSSYISKTKPSADFRALLNYERQGKKVIIPVLFEVTPEELATKYTLPPGVEAIYCNDGLHSSIHRLLEQIDMSHRDAPSKSISIFKSRKGKLYAALALTIGLVLLLYGFSILLTS
jgi:hypothetical protein